MTQGPDIETRPAEPETAEAPQSVRPRGDADGGSQRQPPDPPSTSAYSAVSEDEIEEISFLALANVILKRWKLVLGLPLVVAFLTGIVSLLLPAKYTAASSFISESESVGMNLPSGLAGLASQFGIAVPGAGANSPAFYADVLRSRTLRDQILLASYPDPRGTRPENDSSLLDILKIDGDSERERLEKGHEELEKVVKIQVDDETGIVSLSVKTHYPALSADVANLFVELLNSFNMETRQSEAQERRRFIEGRVAEAGDELRAAEEELKSFLERNRQFQGSPELLFQHDRLQRQVSLKQEVLTTLNREYEESRIEEVNDTPIITVVDRAVPPDERSSPKRTLNVLIALFLGGVFALFGAFGVEFIDRARETDKEEFEEFSTRWRAIKAEFRSLFSRSKS